MSWTGEVGDNVLIYLKALIVGPLPRCVFLWGQWICFGGGRVVEEVRKKREIADTLSLSHFSSGSATPPASQKFGK